MNVFWSPSDWKDLKIFGKHIVFKQSKLIKSDCYQRQVI